MSEELSWSSASDRREEAGRSMTAWAMARRLPQLIRRALALGWRVDRPSVVALLACQAVSAVLGASGLVATTSIISALVGDGPIAGRLSDAAPAISVVAGAAALRSGLGIAISALNGRLAPRIGREAELMLLTAALDAELCAYDTAGYNDRWEAADRGADVAPDLLGESQTIMAAAASLVGAAGVLAYLHPVLLPLLVLAGLPQGVASIRAARVHYLSSVETNSDRRMLGMLRWYVVDKHAADQIRSNTMGGFLLSHYRSTGARVDRTMDRAVWKGAKAATVGALGGGAGSVVVWGALVLLMASGRISIPSAGTAVIGLQTATAGVRGIIGEGTRLFRTGLYLDDWSDFLEEAGGHRMARGRKAPGDPKEIAICAMDYRYPGSERNTLSGIDLTVRRGEILALVGENGAGKTTLSRVISALYLPTGGTVRWDGTDIADIEPGALWGRVAVVPQDFARWPMSARDNIHLGQPAARGDAAVLAAAEAAGADEVVAGLRSGLDTLLAREWWGGEELSGGQWQRIAIARAFHRQAGLLVMDEPTSALDARAEHRIFAGLRGLAEDRAVVLVTHRLANVAIADRIVVLDRGRIIQQGTFADLVADTGGLFHELWTLQNDRRIPGPRAGKP
nr:ABC transporter ATP-binding protein [Streptomyces sp. CBMA156]